jgi:hypothetical protein
VVYFHDYSFTRLEQTSVITVTLSSLLFLVTRVYCTVVVFTVLGGEESFVLHYVEHRVKVVGVRGSIVVKALCCKLEGRGFRFR